MWYQAGDLAEALAEEDHQSPVYVEVGGELYEVVGFDSEDTGGEYLELVIRTGERAALAST